MKSSFCNISLTPKKWLVITLLMLQVGTVSGQFNGRTYQDCLLDATRQGIVNSKNDIGKIKALCEEQFPQSAPDLLGQKLGDDLLAKIDIWTHQTNDKKIKGSIYNGNPDIVVTQLTILLTPKKSNDAVMDFFDSEEYEINLKIPPYKTKSFIVTAEDTAIAGDFYWNLIGAYGY